MKHVAEIVCLTRTPLPKLMVCRDLPACNAYYDPLARRRGALLRLAFATSWILLSARPAQADVPAILSPPVSTSVVVGSSFSLSVSASGGALQFQWQKSGATVPGATDATLNVSNAQPADSGAYSVLVINSDGSTNSVPATVSVLRNIAWSDDFSANPLTHGWVKDQWLPLGGFSWQAAAHTFTIANSTANDSALHRTVTGLLPNHNYKLHAWVRGSQIAGGSVGANICQWNTWNYASAGAGTLGWTSVSLLVTTDGSGAVEVGCRLGYWSNTATGTAIFGNLALEEFLTLTNPCLPSVRAAYVIPSNRTPQTNGVSNLQKLMVQWQAWYRDQMERYGFGPKTFQFETEADGLTPKVCVVYADADDATIRGSSGDEEYFNVTAAASAAGVPVWSPKQIWLLVPEAHLMMADGSVVGGLFLGWGGGSADDSGTAVVSGDALARFDPLMKTNDATFAGTVWLAIGPYPMVNASTFPWFEGTTFSTISSSAQGGALHELSHAFGLYHDYRNDANFNGNLMFNGCRGLRGNFYPGRYPTDYTRLSYAAALVLNTSHYFNSSLAYSDVTPPGVAVTAASSQTPADGLLQINFTATDDVGLSCALLHYGASQDVVGELSLSGSTTNAAFSTPYFNSGAPTTYGISVYDTSGNRYYTNFSINVAATTNQAPQLYVKTSPASAAINEQVVFDASQTAAPNGGNDLRVQWDFDGDGTWDTPLSTSLLVTNSFSTAGLKLVRVRAVDSVSAASISTPLDLRIYEPRLQMQAGPGNVQVSWPVWMAGFDLKFNDSLNAPGSWQPAPAPAVCGIANVFTAPAAGAPQRFFRLERP